MILRFVSIRLLVIGSTILLACGSSERKEAAQQQQRGGSQRPPVRAEAITVSTSTLLDNIEIPGSIVANETTEIRPEVSGLITRIYFREGTFVSRGSVLFKLNDADLQAQLRKLQVQQQIARQNENRSSELLKIGGISRQDYETAQLQTSNTSADISIIQTQIAKTVIRAPFSGKIGFRMVSVGAYVSPATIMTTLSQTSNLKVDFTVPEKYISEIKNGQFINFTVEGNNKNYTARIVATESNITENTRTLQVRAAVQGDAAGLTPGGFAKVTLNFEPDPNAIVIPTQAVIPQARGKKVYLYQGGVAKFVDVETGIRDSSTVQITKGLKVGDTVLLTGLLSLRPEGKVVLAKLNNKPIAPPARQGRDTTKTAAINYNLTEEPQMNISELSLRRPVLAIVMNIIIVVFGVIGFKFLGVRDYPAIDPPNINVRTSYGGANADIIESQITEPLEKAINGIAGIKNITSSSSSQGRSNINVNLIWQ